MRRLTLPPVLRRKIAGFVFLLLGIVSGFYAQNILLASTRNTLTYWEIKDWWANARDNTSPIPGLFLYILTGIFIVLGLHYLTRRLSPLDVRTDLSTQPRPLFGLWLVSLGLSGAVALHSMRAEQYDPYGYLFAAVWILSIALLFFSLSLVGSWRPPARKEAAAWLQVHRAELLSVASVVVIAFLVRCLDVEFHPYSFINDEGQMGSSAECILRGVCTNFFNLGWAAQPQLAFLPTAISVAWLGRTAFAVRFVSVVLGSLSVLAVYLLVRELFDKKVAWLAAMLLATLPVQVHFSRTGVDNIVDSLTAPLILLFLLRGVKRGSPVSFLLAGIVSGLCLYTYPGSLLAPVFGLAALGYLIVRTRGFLQAHSSNLVVFVLAGVVVAAPILGYYSTHSEFFLARFKREGIVENGGLQAEMLTTKKSAAEILTRQFAKSSLVFIATDASLGFYNSPKPYLETAEAMLFMFGLACMLWRIRDFRHTLVFVWFWGAVILGSVLTGGAPTSQRLMMSMPALAIIIAIAMANLAEAFEGLYRPLSRLTPGILLGLVLFVGASNIRFYFYDYRVAHYYEDPKNEITYETQAYTAPLDRNGRLILIGNPNIPYLQFKSFDYFAPHMERATLNDIDIQKLMNIPHDKEVLFIALPDYKSDLELVARYIPGGQWHEVRRRYQPKYILYYIYEVTKERLAGFTR